MSALLLVLFRFRSSTGERGAKRELGYRTCPLCGHRLNKGETVHTIVYPGSTTNTSDSPVERAAEIYGCPYCFPVNRSNPRVCPACKKRVPEDGFIIARMFERPEKRHVHVLGCTGCRGPRRR